MDLAALLIDAADKVRAAHAEGRAALAEVQPEPSVTEVDAALASLPAFAADALRTSPDAKQVWWLSVATPKDRALAQAVARRLAAHGVATSYAPASQDGPPPRLQSLLVDVASLLAAGDRAADAHALSAFSAAWGEFTSATGSAYVNTPAGTLIANGPEGYHTFPPGWQSRPTAELVEEARQALRLPLWRIDDVRRLWGEAIAASGAHDPRSAHVAPMPGYHVGGLYRDVPCLVLVGGDTTVTLDHDDILDMTAADVVARAAERLGWPNTTVALAAPSEPPAPSPAEPPRRLSRAERREAYRRDHA